MLVIFEMPGTHLAVPPRASVRDAIRTCAEKEAFVGTWLNDCSGLAVDQADGFNPAPVNQICGTIDLQRPSGWPFKVKDESSGGVTLD